MGDKGGLYILVGHTGNGHDVYIGQFGKGGQAGALAGNGVVSLVQAGGRIGQGSVGTAGQPDGQTVAHSAQAGQGTALFAFLLGLLCQLHGHQLRQLKPGHQVIRGVRIEGAAGIGFGHAAVAHHNIQDG